MSNSGNLNCPFCGKEIRPTDTYCPTCGTKIPDVNLPFSTWQKIKIYAISFFLAPLGLFWFIKYFRNDNPAKKKTAYIALYITIATIVVVSVLSAYYVKKMNAYIGTYDFNEINGLGL